jgi:hypothetical protein
MARKGALICLATSRRAQRGRPASLISPPHGIYTSE